MYVYITFAYPFIHRYTLQLLPHFSYLSNAAMNVGIQISLPETLFSILLVIYPEVELLDHMVVLFIIVLRNCHTLFLLLDRDWPGVGLPQAGL